MARKKTVRKTDNGGRNLDKADGTEARSRFMSPERHDEGYRAVPEDVWYAGDETDLHASIWYGVENLFGGEFEAIHVVGTPEMSQNLSERVTSQREMAAFTLAYEGRGIFRYALPSEEESTGDVLNLVPNDPSQIGSHSASLKPW